MTSDSLGTVFLSKIEKAATLAPSVVKRMNWRLLLTIFLECRKYIVNVLTDNQRIFELFSTNIQPFNNFFHVRKQA